MNEALRVLVTQIITPVIAARQRRIGAVAFALALLIALQGALPGALSPAAVAQSPAEARLPTSSVAEGETAVLQILDVPEGRSHYLRLKPFQAPYTADASDVVVRAGADHTALSPGVAVSVVRQSDGAVSFSVAAQADSVSDAGETFGIQLCSSTDCAGGNLLGDWTISITESPNAVSPDSDPLPDVELDDGNAELFPSDDPDGVGLGQPLADASVADLLGPDGIYVMKDGDRKIPLRLLTTNGAAMTSDAASAAALAGVHSTADLDSLAAGAGFTYAEASVGASSSDSNQTARPRNWLVSEGSELFLLVGGVNVLFDSRMSQAEIAAVLERHQVVPDRVSGIGDLTNAFLIRTVSDAEALLLADALAAEPGVEVATPNVFTPLSFGPPQDPQSLFSPENMAKRRCDRFDDPWSDRMSSCLWYFDSSTNYRYWSVDPTIDINLDDVWSTTMGAGITVAVVDGTWEPGHEDLVDNADKAGSTNWGGFTTENPDSSLPHHGTAVAGIIGARDNAVGGRGVAPRVTLQNFNFLDSQSTYTELAAMMRNTATVAVSNHSYGKRISNRTTGASTAWYGAVTMGIDNGFGGKGVSYVKAAGNGKGNTTFKGAGWAPLDGQNNHRGIIPVCAVNSQGRSSWYSSEGPNLWVCAPSGDGRTQPAMLVPKGLSSYTDRFSGTSAAAPIVSGVIALMRSVNGDLTWRDVKLILANTAQKNDPTNSSWETAATRYGSATEKYSYSNKYGFGLVNAKAAVDAAMSWTLLPPLASATVSASASPSAPVSLPAYTQTIEFPLNIQTTIDFVEYVNLTIDGDSYDFRDFKVTLVSPSGIESLLSPSYIECGKQCRMYAWFMFGSARHLGENPSGTWKLKIQNNAPKVTTCGRLSVWYLSPFCRSINARAEHITQVKLDVYGHTTVAASPVTLSASPLSLTEGGEVGLTVSVGTAPTTDITIPIMLTAGSATPPGATGADYQALSSITVAAGTSSATGKIVTTQDNINEEDETFSVSLGWFPAGYSGSGTKHTVTITDDDVTPTLTLTTSKNTLSEGETVEIGATLDQATSDDVTVNLSATSVAPADPADAGFDSPPAVLTIPAGTTTASVTRAFQAASNDVYELSGSTAKTFRIAGTISGSASITDPDPITLTISDDDAAPEISISAVGNILEGQSAEFTLTASRETSAELPVTVNVTQSGNFGVTTGTRTVTLPTSGAATLTIATTNDDTVEPDGSITVTIEAGTDYTPASTPSATATVADETKPVVSIAADGDITEGASASFTLSANPTPTADLTVSVTVTDSGAYAATGAAGAQTVTISAHTSTAALTVNTDDDSTNEGDGSLTATLDPQAADAAYSVSAGADSASVAVTDNDGALPIDLSLSVDDAIVSENNGQTVLRIRLSRELQSGESVRVPIAVSGGQVNTNWNLTDPSDLGTAVTRTAYGANSEIRIGAGGQVATLAFNGRADSDDAHTPITIAFGTGARAPSASGIAEGISLGSSIMVVVAEQHSGDPVVSISGGGGITEGGSASFTVTASPAPAAGLPVTLVVSSSGSYGVASGIQTVTVPFGGSKTISVATSDDQVEEDDGFVAAALLTGSGYQISSTHRIFRVIVADDDDVLPEISIASDGDVTEGASASFTVTATPFPQADLDVSVTVSQSGDYGASVGQQTVTITTSGSATVTVSTSDDSTEEADGSISATLDDPASDAGYTVDSSAKTASVAVSDNDHVYTLDPQLVTDVRSYAAEVHHGADHVNRWKRVLEAFGVESYPDLEPMTAAEGKQKYGTLPRWQTVIPALEAIEAAGTVIVTVTPEVSITAAADVTEGGNAEFTVTATPAPQADLPVSVTVSQSGDYGASVGQQTVTIPTTGSATLTVSTSDDSTDETDGSVTATVNTGSGYTVSSSQGAGTVAVSDNDAPTPEVSITAGSGVTEGGNAEFTVTATPAPQADLDVSVTVSQSGDFGASVGQQTVTIPATGSATLTVSTSDDSTDESDGSVTATVNTGSGYTVSSSQGAGTVAVSDNDGTTTGPVLDAQLIANVRSYAAEVHHGEAHVNRWKRVLEAFGLESYPDLEPMTAAEGKQKYGTLPRWQAVIPALEAIEAATPEVNIQSFSGGTEGQTVTFEIAANPAPSSDLEVGISVVTAGDFGYGSIPSSVTIPTGGSVTLSITTADDSVDEPDGTVSLTLNSGSGYTVGSSGTGSADVTDDEPTVAPVVQDPEVSITAGSGVTEGGNAEFTVTATPAPQAELPVSVTVSQSGDFGASVGQQTVTIPTTGSATLTIATSDDSTDETDGSVTATVNSGSGYTVSSSQGAGTVAVSDNDAEPTGPVLDAQLESDVRSYAAEVQHGTLHVNRWKRVLEAFGLESYPDLEPTTLDEARVHVDIGRPRWVPVLAHMVALDAVNPQPTLTSSTVQVDAQVLATARSRAGETHKGAVHVNRWKRVLEAFGDADYPNIEPLTAAGAQVYANVWSGWTSIAAQLRLIEAGATINPPPVVVAPTPEVSITAGSGVTEGGNAEFTVTATPAPQADLPVSVTVSQSGDFGASVGQQTVTIPTTGSATLTISTSDDSTDETDGSVTATVNSGSGYTVSSSQGAGTVAVSDNDAAPTGYTVDPTVVAQVQALASQTQNGADHVNRWQRVLVAFGVLDASSVSGGAMTAAEAQQMADNHSSPVWDLVVTELTALEAGGGTNPPVVVPTTPVVSISGGNAVTEGGDVEFTVSALPAPAAGLAVTLNLTTVGSYGVSAGSRTVTVPTTGSVTLTLTTSDDNADEPNGSVTATLVDGASYDLGASKTATVNVSDNDVTVAPVVVPDPVVSISGGNAVTEGGDVEFTVSALPAPAAGLAVTLNLTTAGSYGVSAGSRTVTVPTTGSVTLTLTTSDDSTDEPNGSVTATLVDGASYDLGASKTATVNVSDNDVTVAPVVVPDPVVSISAGAGVTEGGSVEFTVTASPSPSAALPVSVTISQSGDFGATTGSRTVTIPTSGSATLTIATSDDSTDESDGSVTATVNSGSGYTVSSSQGAGTVAVSDNDVPPTPVVSISAGSAVTEGGNVEFTVTASPRPTAALAVEVTITQAGDFGASTGSRTVTIPTSGSITLSIATSDDSADESDGSVTATLVDGAAYDLGANKTGTVAVSDNDDPPPSSVMVSVADASGQEYEWVVDFSVTLSEASSEAVSVRFTTYAWRGATRETLSQRAKMFIDYQLTDTTVVFAPGETERTVSVWLTDDSRSESEEHFTVELSNPQGASIGQAEATGTILDDD